MLGNVRRVDKFVIGRVQIFAPEVSPKVEKSQLLVCIGGGCTKD